MIFVFARKLSWRSRELASSCFSSVDTPISTFANQVQDAKSKEQELDAQLQDTIWCTAIDGTHESEPRGVK
jgi:hypothetical protein